MEIKKIGSVGQNFICNKCGLEKDLRGHEFPLSFICYFNYGGDWSRFRKKFPMQADFLICEDCLIEFAKTFKYDPDGFFK